LFGDFEFEEVDDFQVVINLLAPRLTQFYLFQLLSTFKGKWCVDALVLLGQIGMDTEFVLDGSANELGSVANKFAKEALSGRRLVACRQELLGQKFHEYLAVDFVSLGSTRE
jgi:hypothetical protein